MTDESLRDQCTTRRCVLLGAGVLGAAGLLTACSTSSVPYDANDGGQAPKTDSPMPSEASSMGTSSMSSGMGTSSMSSGMGASASASMSAQPSDAATSSMSSMTSGAASGAMMGTVLGAVADIPVGGGMIFTAAKVVATQPTKGVYKVFSAVCTHVGCVCNQVANGTIDCPCHGSKFSITDGAVVAGPAPTALAAKSFTISNGKILLT
jgi:Rieske Fe-S protein